MITYLLMGLMILVSVAILLWPELAETISGVGVWQYPWQPWTAVFVHGWPGMPLVVHLTGNLILLLLVGPPVERRLGKGRFLIVTFTAVGVAGLVAWLTRLEFNGASAFIWAYAPPLWWLHRQEKQPGRTAVFWLIWLIIPLTMSSLLLLNGTPLLLALLGGNAYHLSGTAVGLIATWVWQNQLTTPVDETRMV